MNYIYNTFIYFELFMASPQQITQKDLEPLFHPFSNKAVPGNMSISQLNEHTKLSTQLLGQYGMKNAAQVQAFLKSPAGARVKKLVEEHLSYLKEIKNAQYQHLLKTHLQRLRIKAFLALMAIYEEKAKAKELNEATQRQIDRELARNYNKIQQDYKLASEQTTLAQTYWAYQLASKIIESELDQKLTEAQEVKKEITTLEQEKEEIEARYVIFEKYLIDLYTQYDLFEARTANKSMEEKHLDIEKQLAKIKKTIEEKGINIAKLFDAREDSSTLTKEDFSKFSKLTYELQALNLQAIGLEQILSVLEAKNLFYNALGERVTSYRMADFVLSTTQRLYVDQGTGATYLLTATADLDSMALQSLFNSLSLQDKLSAKSNYELAKPQISTMKGVVANKDVELAMHAERMDTALNRSATIQQQISKLTNQASTLTSLMGQLSDELNATHAQAPTPRPTPSVQQNITQSYKQALTSMKSNPTPEAIAKFKGYFNLPNGRPNEKAQHLIDSAIQPGKPIPPATMNALLANLARLGVSANKPNVTAIPDKTPTQAPTPFKTKPSPF